MNSGLSQRFVTDRGAHAGNHQSTKRREQTQDATLSSRTLKETTGENEDQPDGR